MARLPFNFNLAVIASEAKQSIAGKSKDHWIASSLRSSQ
jgi:hypothetical protein